MLTRRLVNKTEIRAYLETDREYAAYAIGDLDDGFFERCAWNVAEAEGRISALALAYSGFDPPALFLMGAGDGVEALLDSPAQIERAYVAAREEHLAALGQYYRWGKLDDMWRMVLRRPDGFWKPFGSCKRLGANDIERLQALYSLGGGGAFSPSQVALGVFYGVEQDGQLVAAAGTHLVSATYSVGAIGNVTTHPAYRGRQYATQATGAVCAELIQRSITTIALNVQQDNAPAARVYEKLGFTRYCPFYEGVIERIRVSVDPGFVTPSEARGLNPA